MPEQRGVAENFDASTLTPCFLSSLLTFLTTPDEPFYFALLLLLTLHICIIGLTDLIVVVGITLLDNSRFIHRHVFQYLVLVDVIVHYILPNRSPTV